MNAIPALQHVETGLGQIMAARQLADLLGEPGVELRHQRCTEFLADASRSAGLLPLMPRSMSNQGIETLHGFERDRIDHGACAGRGSFLRAELTTSASSKNLRRAWAKQPASSTGPGWRPSR